MVETFVRFHYVKHKLERLQENVVACLLCYENSGILYNI